MKKLLVFDIDQTLVDSSIRENFCFFGDVLDLPIYQKQKHDNELGIFCDSLLPLGEWLEKNAINYDFALCTARQFELADFESLYSLMPNTLSNARHIMSRNNSLDYGGNTCESSGHYKRPLLKWLAYWYKRPLLVIDDCLKVQTMAKNDGHSTLCARELWHYSPDEIGEKIELCVY